MKIVAKILLLVILFSVGVHAQKLAMSSNPYASVVERNVFGLVPIPTNPPVDPTPAIPPPKITPNGIMSLFGKFQVLFKVATPAKMGQPQKDDSYVLSEGERQDDIEVKKIDEKKGMITFDNHGTIQELPLANAPNISTPAPSPITTPGLPQRFPRPQFGGGNSPFGNRPDALRNRVASGGNPTAPGAPTFGSPNVSSGGNNGNNNDADTQLSPEAQIIAIEANRIATQDDVNAGKLPSLPPTVLTPADATGPGGAPLVTSPEPIDPPAKK